MADIVISYWRHGKCSGSIMVEVGTHRERVGIGQKILVLLHGGETIEIQNDDIEEIEDGTKNPE